MKVAILESNDQIFGYLESLIKTLYMEWHVLRYLSSFALVTGIADELKGDIDLILIHIPPHQYDYIYMAKDMQNYFSHIRIIFYSEANDCAEQIFTAFPSFFLQLPVNKELLQEALLRVEEDTLSEVGQTITLKFKGEIQRIKYSAISHIESVGRKIRFYTNQGIFEVYMTMSEAKEKLPMQFRQCHRSFMVNTDKIDRVTSEGVLLSNMELVPLSRSYFEEIRRACQKSERGIR